MQGMHESAKGAMTGNTKGADMTKHAEAALKKQN
jgi:hypothetical protein